MLSLGFRLNLLGVFLVLFLLPSCSTWKLFLKEPKVHLDSVKVAEAGHSGVTVVFGIRVENPNTSSVTVNKVTYDLALNGKPFTRGEIEKPIAIPAQGETTVEIPMTVRYQDVLGSLMRFLSDGKTPYVLTGSARVGPFQIPFKKEGDLKL